MQGFCAILDTNRKARVRDAVTRILPGRMFECPSTSAQLMALLGGQLGKPGSLRLFQREQNV